MFKILAQHANFLRLMGPTRRCIVSDSNIKNIVNKSSLTRSTNQKRDDPTPSENFHPKTLSQHTTGKQRFPFKQQAKFNPNNKEPKPNSSLYAAPKFPITNTHEALVYLKFVSDKLIAEFSAFKFVSSVKYYGVELMQQNRDQLEFVQLKSQFVSNENFARFVAYVSEHLSEFSAAEKAAVFKILAIFSDNNGTPSDPLHALLAKLEADFYNVNMSELSVVDLVNYGEAFAHFRPVNIHFWAHSLDHICRVLQDSFTRYFQLVGIIIHN